MWWFLVSEVSLQVGRPLQGTWHSVSRLARTLGQRSRKLKNTSQNDSPSNDFTSNTSNNVVTNNDFTSNTSPNDFTSSTLHKTIC